MRKPKRDTIIRLSVSAALAAAAVVLFVLNRISAPRSPEEQQEEFMLTAEAIDREVEGALHRFGIEKEWVQKKVIVGREGRFVRIERRVFVPPDVVPALLNRELNLLARRFQGKAVATENLKEDIVTIHVLLRESVIQTLILKPHPDIQKTAYRGQQRDV